jgi:6-phosphogluconolactonase
LIDMSLANLIVHPDVATLVVDAAGRIVDAASSAIAGRGAFHWVLAGGNTPRSLYEAMAGEPWRSRIDWTKTHVYFGDERCVPPDHADSNYRMAKAAMLDRVPLPAGQVQRIRGEIDPESAAVEYGRMLKAVFGDGGADLTLLGMGDDGHTASLFPGTGALAETHHRCVANFVPAKDSWRVTMTAPFLNRSRQVMALIAGESKTARLKEVLHGPHEPQRLPIQLIRPAPGELVYMVDAAAAGAP